MPYYIDGVQQGVPSIANVVQWGCHNLWCVIQVQYYINGVQQGFAFHWRQQQKQSRTARRALVWTSKH